MSHRFCSPCANPIRTLLRALAGPVLASSGRRALAAARGDLRQLWRFCSGGGRIAPVMRVVGVLAGPRSAGGAGEGPCQRGGRSAQPAPWPREFCSCRGTTWSAIASPQIPQRATAAAPIGRRGRRRAARTSPASRTSRTSRPAQQPRPEQAATIAAAPPRAPKAGPTSAPASPRGSPQRTWDFAAHSSNRRRRPAWPSPNSASRSAG